MNTLYILLIFETVSSLSTLMTLISKNHIYSKLFQRINLSPYHKNVNTQISIYNQYFDSTRINYRLFSTSFFGLQETVLEPSTNITAKRKCALIIGYTGTNYYGLQHVPNQPDHPSVETILAKALHEGGFISDSNYDSFTSKLSWTRSSRTDKGVHASKMIISTKLEIPITWLDSSVNNQIDNTRKIVKDDFDNTNNNKVRRFPQLVDKVNSLLPSDIRVFSCVKINNGFNARNSCHWREYEYLLPIETMNMMSDHSFNPISNESNEMDKSNKIDEINQMKRLNQSLSKYLGSQSFHNFHRLGSKALLRPNPWTIDDFNYRNKSSRDISNNLNTNNNVNSYLNINPTNNIDQNNTLSDYTVESNDIESNNLELDDVESNDLSLEYYDFEEMMKNIYTIYDSVVTDEYRSTLDRKYSSLHERLVVPKTHTCIYYCQVQDIVEINQQRFYRIVLRGKSFLFHQIRLMISAAILETKGIVPNNTIELALKAPIKIEFPLAPAAGLLLVDAGIGFTRLHVQPMAISTLSSGYYDEYPLMLDSEYDQSNQFKLNHIYKQVQLDWNELVTPSLANQSMESNQSVEVVPLLQDWAKLLEHYRPPAIVSKAWKNVYEYINHHYSNVKATLSEKEGDRVERQIVHFHKLNETYTKIVRMNNNRKKYKGKNKDLDEEMNMIKKALPIPHRKILPDGLCTELCVKYNTTPGVLISKALSVIATDMVSGTISPPYSIDTIIAYIEVKGGLEKIAENGYVHPMIN